VSTRQIYNFRFANDSIITGGMPTAEQIRSAAEEGFEAVINLATYEPGHSLENEAGLVEALGMTYHHIPVVWNSPQMDDFIRFEIVLKGLATRKVLIHCAANFRATAFYSLYALKNLQWTQEKARAFRASIWQGSSYPVWEAFIQQMEAKILAS
jgi:protein tyrosine phosphatase (PTP) superfamily phosphohydrolase (DUF442 family)